MTLQTNLERHKKNFAEAMVGFEAARKDKLRDVERAAKGAYDAVGSTALSDSLSSLEKAYQSYQLLQKPQNHAESYEQAIALMEWDTRAEIELTIEEFENYIRDNWKWTFDFHNTVGNYSNSH